METNYIAEGIKITNAHGVEEIIYIPYNLDNIFITDKDIITILSKYNVKINKINHI
jgi:hypothetical protein